MYRNNTTLDEKLDFLSKNFSDLMLSSDADPINGERRLRAYRAAQSFFAQRNALIVFEEAEDVFNDGDALFGRKSTAQTRKARINRTLEENPVPTLWLSNAISGMDQSALRRFDLKVKFDFLQPEQACGLLLRHCAALEAEYEIKGGEEAADRVCLSGKPGVPHPRKTT